MGCVGGVRKGCVLFGMHFSQSKKHVYLILFFSKKNFKKYCRLQQDSNSDRQSRRRACWPLDHNHVRIRIIAWIPLMSKSIFDYTLRENLTTKCRKTFDQIVWSFFFFQTNLLETSAGFELVSWEWKAIALNPRQTTWSIPFLSFFVCSKRVFVREKEILAPP